MEVEVLREERIDKYLAEELGISRSTVKKMIDEGFVLVNGKEVKASLILSEADELFVKDGFIKEASFEAEDIPINIVYEDDDLLVINKKSGMVVHPGNGNTSGTLVNALMHYTKNLSNKEAFRPGIVHRIDKDTSGLLIVAKNDFAHFSLAEQIKEHSFTREYEAIVYGNLKDDEGTVNAPIGRSQYDRKKMCVTEKNSKHAVTHYRVIARYKGYTHIKCILETGRTHQIRVHMAYIGHPVSGDLVYGVKNEKVDFTGQCLHARKIGFVHPRSGEYLEFTSQLPEYFRNYLEKLDKITK